MIHGKLLTEEELRKEVETQKQLMEFSKGKPIIAAVHENPNGDGDHIASLLLTGLAVLKDSINEEER